MWWAINGVAFGALGPWIAILAKRGKFAAAQSLGILLMSIVWIQLILWGTASSLIRTASVDLSHAKPMLLGIAGGVTAQFVILVEGAIAGTLPKEKLAPIFYRGLLGVLGGSVGLLVASLRYADIQQVGDQIAMFAGLVGGVLGSSLIKRFIKAPKELF